VTRDIARGSSAVHQSHTDRRLEKTDDGIAYSRW